MNKVFRLVGAGLLALGLLASGPALQAQTGTGATQVWCCTLHDT